MNGLCYMVNTKYICQQNRLGEKSKSVSKEFVNLRLWVQHGHDRLWS